MHHQKLRRANLISPQHCSVADPHVPCPCSNILALTLALWIFPMLRQRLHAHRALPSAVTIPAFRRLADNRRSCLPRPSPLLRRHFGKLPDITSAFRTTFAFIHANISFPFAAYSTKPHSSPCRRRSDKCKRMAPRRKSARWLQLPGDSNLRDPKGSRLHMMTCFSHLTILLPSSPGRPRPVATHAYNPSYIEHV